MTVPISSVQKWSKFMKNGKITGWIVFCSITLLVVVFALAAARIPSTSKVPEWDLTEMFENDDDFYACCTEIENKLIPEYKKMTEEFNSVSDVAAVLKKRDEIAEILKKCNAFIHLQKLINVIDKAPDILRTTFFMSCKDFCEITFEQKLLEQNEDFWNQMMKDKSLESYYYELSELKRLEKYSKQAIDAKILNNTLAETLNTANQINNSYIKYPEIQTPEGKKIEANYMNWFSQMTNKNRDYRKKYLEAVFSANKKFNEYHVPNYINYVNKSEEFARTLGYENLLEKTLNEDGITLHQFETILNYARKNAPVLALKNSQIQRDFLGYDELWDYDLHMLHGSVKLMPVFFNKAEKIIKDSLAVLGDDYVSALKKAFSENWIDAPARQNKVNGAFAYEVGTYHPFVIINNTNDYGTVDALTHELGHAMQMYFSSKNDTYKKREVSILSTEVCSITNELLTFDYLIKNAKTNKQRLYFYLTEAEIIYNTFFGTLLRTDFERQIHKIAEESGELNAEIINNTYLDCLKFYNGGSIKYSAGQECSWQKMPHFYMNYYTYKYAVDIAVASQIVKNIEENKDGYLEKYLHYISRGNDAPVVEQWKDLEINIDDEEYFDALMERYEDCIKTIEKLLLLGV